jgi:predicted Zn-dependent protease
MISIGYKNRNIRFILVSLLMLASFMALNACTIKHAPVKKGTIPDLAAPSPAAEHYGKHLYTELLSDYKLDSEVQKKDELIKILDNLTVAAGADDLPWNVYIFNDPEIVDIRAVHGNYIFVWTGTFDTVDSDDELAGIIACELAHVLARHTDPVEFTLTSEVLFGVTELATSIGLMVASQGMIAISGQGWMKWAYVEITDLDPLDREYSEEHEREAASIALLILSRSKYSPHALLDLWKRIAADETLQARFERMSRDLSPQERATMLEALIAELPEEELPQEELPDEAEQASITLEIEATSGI